MAINTLDALQLVVPAYWDIPGDSPSLIPVIFLTWSGETWQPGEAATIDQTYFDYQDLEKFWTFHWSKVKLLGPKPFGAYELGEDRILRFIPDKELTFVPIGGQIDNPITLNLKGKLPFNRKLLYSPNPTLKSQYTVAMQQSSNSEDFLGDYAFIYPEADYREDTKGLILRAAPFWQQQIGPEHTVGPQPPAVLGGMIEATSEPPPTWIEVPPIGGHDYLLWRVRNYFEEQTLFAGGIANGYLQGWPDGYWVMYGVEDAPSSWVVQLSSDGNWPPDGSYRQGVYGPPYE